MKSNNNNKNKMLAFLVPFCGPLCWLALSQHHDRQLSHRAVILNGSSINFTVYVCIMRVFLLLVTLVTSSMAAMFLSAPEMNALWELYSNTDGGSWRWRKSETSGPLWNFSLDVTGSYIHNPCSDNITNSTSGEISVSKRAWQGVTCSRSPALCSAQTCHITEINLKAFRLSGSLPVAMRNFSQLQILVLDYNQLTGPIPVELGDLSALKSLSLYVNQLTGSIPPELGRLLTLTHLALDINLFTGSIPSQLCDLSLLMYLYIGQSYISGSIPIEIGQLTNMREMTFHRTVLSGTIPSSIGNLTKLKELTFYENFLTGSVPSEVGLLTRLELLSFSINHLTGSIPESFGDLAVIDLLFFYSNMVTGTIPTSLGRLSVVEVLDLSDSLLVGTIPREVGQLTKLKEIALNGNLLTGTIPLSIGNLTHLDELLLQDNLLTGALPAEMSDMTALKSMFLRSNRFTGMATGAFSYSSQQMLATIDLSNNRLSGSIGEEMFLLPQLKVLALSVNCFNEELPQSMCLARKLEVLSLNGLRAADGCAGVIAVPLSGVRLFNAVGGTVPACLWSLPNLTTLHLTGNGLTGILPFSIPHNSTLSDLSLSHNQLTGTIPSSFLRVPNLDLSSNQLTGEFNDGGDSDYPVRSRIRLEINRLSGHLPVSALESISTGSVGILKGNIFSCRSIPDNDEYARDYVCGSRNLNDALVVFVTMLGVAVMVVGGVGGLLASSRRPLPLDETQEKGGGEGSHWLVVMAQERAALLWSLLTYMSRFDTTRRLASPRNPVIVSGVTEVLHTIAQLSASFLEIIRCAVELLGIILAGSTAFYLVKLLDTTEAYATHSHTYAWFWTLAYTRGAVPAALLLTLWVVAITGCFAKLVVISSLDRGERRSMEKVEAMYRNSWKFGEETATLSSRIVPVAVAFVFNACVTVAVNTMYIYSTQQDLAASVHFSIQLGLSIFRLVYTAAAFPVLSRSLRSAVDSVRFRFILLSINNLLIPCVVTALTSDLCFQGLLIPAESVSTAYSYQTCRWYEIDGAGVMYCDIYGREYVNTTSVVPAFNYNYQCGTVVLTAYIPVFLLSTAIQLFLPAVLVVSLIHIPYGSISSSMRSMLHGLMWPDHWVTGVHHDVTDVEDVMLKIRSIYCNDVFNNWMLLLTFGLCSPVLAVGIVAVVATKMSLWVLLIGRFTRYILEHEKEEEEAGSTSREAGGSPLKFTAPPPAPAPAPAAVVVISPISGKDGGRGGGAHVALTALAEAHIPLHAVLAGSFWRLAWCSALFVGLLCWDMAADEVGWQEALWAPLAPVGYTALLTLASHLLNFDVAGKFSRCVARKCAGGCWPRGADPATRRSSFDSSDFVTSAIVRKGVSGDWGCDEHSEKKKKKKKKHGVLSNEPTALPVPPSLYPTRPADRTSSSRHRIVIDG